MNKVILYTIKVNGANPNGDPNTGNEPRVDSEGYGVISQFCIKHHIRNRFVDMGLDVYQMNDDGKQTISEKVNDVITTLKLKKNDQDCANKLTKALMDKYVDIGLFGATNAVVTNDICKLSNVKAAVTFNDAVSVEPLSIERMCITHCITLNGDKNGNDKKSDSMGRHYYVKNASYVGHCVINSNRISKNNVKDASIDILKNSICNMFNNDESAARPSGTIKICDVFEVDIPDSVHVDVFDIEEMYRNIVCKNGSFDDITNKFTDITFTRLK